MVMYDLLTYYLCSIFFILHTSIPNVTGRPILTNVYELAYCIKLHEHDACEQGLNTPSLQREHDVH